MLVVAASVALVAGEVIEIDACTYDICIVARLADALSFLSLVTSSVDMFSGFFTAHGMFFKR